ncbi:hypothetical protein ACFOG5_24835 [Pedobacter fastidiosus]
MKRLPLMQVINLTCIFYLISIITSIVTLLSFNGKIIGKSPILYNVYF